MNASESTLTIGMIGLGKMGGNMSRRLINGGHHVIGFDFDEQAVEALRGAGGGGASTVENLAAELPQPRYIWLMVPAGDPVDSTIEALLPHLSDGDVIIDGGNSNYHDTLKRADYVQDKGLHFVDVGVSGGVWGLDEGYSLMVGGDEEPVNALRPIFETLAPGKARGWDHLGKAGAGHFAKMIHNGIEYGMMQAFAEGFAILEAKEEFDFDLARIAGVWQHGSVVRSWLLDLVARALDDNPALQGLAPHVPDSGEGRWTVKEAIDLDVPAPVITDALIQRLQSRQEDDFGFRLLSALRNQFGGHAMKKTEE